MGWVVVQGDSGDRKDLLLLVIDTRTEVKYSAEKMVPGKGLRPGNRVRVRYRMGWDALHALEVERLAE
jgi:hypothetical protein